MNQREADLIRFMSFNLGLAPAESVISAIEKENADVVGLQELGEQMASELDRALSERYPWRSFYPGGYEGKALLSKLPVLSIQQLHLAPNRPDLYAVIEVDNRPISVLVAHPRPPRLRRFRLLFDSHTEDQLVGLTELAVNTDPAVVLGDFNVTSRQARYAQLINAGLRDSFAETGSKGATLPARVGPTKHLHRRWHGRRLRPIVRIDYIFITQRLQAVSSWVGADGGSDHLPVVADIGWRDQLAE